MVAVMAFNRVTEFTSDHEAAARVIEQLKGSPLAVRYAMTLSAQSGVPARVERDRSRPSAGIQAVIDSYFHPLTVRSATSFLLGTSAFRENDQIYGRPSRQPPWDYWLVSVNMNLLRVQAGVEYLRTAAPVAISTWSRWLWASARHHRPSSAVLPPAPGDCATSGMIDDWRPALLMRRSP
jgi:hypothetical protein